MPVTEVRSGQIKDATVGRSDVNIATPGQAIIAKVVAGTGISISSTGADTGTGDVTITAAGGGAPAAHHATHEIGGTDVLVNAAWLNQANFFTITQTLSSANPVLRFIDTSMGTDLKTFRIINSSQQLYIQSMLDSGGTQADALIMTRAGDVTVGRNLTALGSGGNVACKDQANVFTMNQEISAGPVRLRLTDTSGAVDSKVWQIQATGGDLFFRALNDAATVVINDTVTMRRSGDVVVARNLDVIGSGGNVACKDQANTFTLTNSFADLFISGQVDITGGTGTGYSTAPIEIMTTANPRIAFHWPGVVAAQIGMDSAGTIRTYDNPGTGYQGFACLNIYTSVGGTSVADLTCRGGTNFQGGLYMSVGNLTGPGSLALNGSIQSGSYMYPGAITNPGVVQSSWYLAGHSSYGLYTNTGMYFAGGVWSATHLWTSGAVTGSDFYEKGRTTPVGHWIDFTPAGYSGLTITTNYACKYMLVGKTLTVSFYLSVNVVSGPPIGIFIPAGLVASANGAIPMLLDGGVGMAQSTPGANYIAMYASITGTAIATGARLVGTTFSFQVN